ncbi:hypothetical protein L3X37_07130 [Sabulilitoribacter arenilitoris]|uniref:Lipoprotein n=1 Tax=Wocania arenilitoris TaxID=2044858 RepID=A0AAE3JLD1_9FLAO|nr:hypothetical protein [Wocania arenilitoris]MCF7568134.1 hypothetical protein [Wocania arenilitoris]
MNKKTFALYTILAMLLSSCYSYRVQPKEFRKLENTNTQPKAYIINRTLEKEVEILKSSELFIIVEDSLHADLNIKLYPINKYRRGGDGTICSITIFLTIMQLPCFNSSSYKFKFDEIYKENIKKNNIELFITKPLWTKVP